MERDDVMARLRDTLSAAVRSRDMTMAGVLRSTLAAIANAEAVAPDLAGAASAATSPIAGTVLGVGSADIPRRRLEPNEIRDVVRSEIAERERAAREYESFGQAPQAAALRAETLVLAQVARNLDLA